MNSAKVTAKQQWESSDFPILCETCLGENPMVQMQRAGYDKECKICTRPFMVFRYRPGQNARMKKTEICQSCAKLKHVCQTCLLDLEFNVPVQVRDSLVQAKDQIVMPKSDVNREWFADQLEKDIEEGKVGATGAQRLEVKNMMSKLARGKPYFSRNDPHVCSFFVKGECKRGEACPFKHVLPSEKDIPKNNHPDSFKNRYFGTNDPVANKLLNKIKVKKLTPPSDPAIKTLRLGNVDQEISKEDIEGQLYGWGTIINTHVNYNSRTAFVEYSTRQEAETAAEKLYNNLKIKDKPLTVGWKTESQASSADSSSFKYAKNSSSSTSSQMPYPSMNPRQFGSKKN